MFVSILCDIIIYGGLFKKFCGSHFMFCDKRRVHFKIKSEKSEQNSLIIHSETLHTFCPLIPEGSRRRITLGLERLSGKLSTLPIITTKSHTTEVAVVITTTTL